MKLTLEFRTYQEPITELNAPRLVRIPYGIMFLWASREVILEVFRG